jgi:CheY-like chemotaxis protein
MEKQKILYIDDSAVEREIVCRMLEGSGFVVLTTGKPDEGIEIARRMNPDLILVDLHMPEMDGCAIARFLRTISKLDAVPIIAFSASINEDEKEEALAFFDGFVEKPVDIDIFPDQILGLIQAGRQEGGVAGEETRAGEGEAVPAVGEEELLEILERMRAAMSHDLRTPLTVMISYASTVGREKAGGLTPRQKEMLEVVVDQGFQMDSLISALVKLARETLDRYGYQPK